MHNEISLSPKIQEFYDNYVEHDRKGTANEIERRYSLCRDLMQAYEAENVFEDDYENLLLLICLDKGTAQKYRRIAFVISSHELKDLCEVHPYITREKRLSWQHIEHLSSLAKRHLRDAVVEWWREQTDVKQLTAEAMGKKVSDILRADLPKAVAKVLTTAAFAKKMRNLNEAVLSLLCEVSDLGLSKMDYKERSASRESFKRLLMEAANDAIRDGFKTFSADSVNDPTASAAKPKTKKRSKSKRLSGLE